MSRRRSKQRFEFDTMHLEGKSSETQYQQLENQIRQAISSGLLPAQARIPSSRALAKKLEVSRNTVLAAYQQLISEGYLESEVGSGTRVSSLPPEAYELRGRSRTPVTVDDSSNCLSATGKQLAAFAQWLPDILGKPQPFRPHLPAVDEFPVKVWNRFMIERARWTSQQLEQCDPQGYRPLRESIAEYMRISRGTACTAEQVIVTAGAQQGLSLVMQLLLDSNDVVWVEEPGNAPANQLLNLSQTTVQPVPLDSEGIDLSSMAHTKAKPKLIYVTPSGQWPMGMTMSLNRRLQLLSESQRHGSWIIEDDYNGEYRFTGRPHPTLYTLDQSNRTIYMGTFSKLLFPAIRLGFLIVPTHLSKTFAYARWLNDRFSPPLPQMVLHRFIESGHFLKHIRQMRSLYRIRQQFLYHSLLRHFKGHIEVDLPESGMHLVVKGVTPQTESKLITSAERAGVEFHTVKMYADNPKQVRGLILGFAAFDEQASNKAVKAWAREFKKL